MQTCAQCGDILPLSASRCFSCKQVYYCDQKCQLLHWKHVHKNECDFLVYKASTMSPEYCKYSAGWEKTVGLLLTYLLSKLKAEKYLRNNFQQLCPYLSIYSTLSFIGSIIVLVVSYFTTITTNSNIRMYCCIVTFAIQLVCFHFDYQAIIKINVLNYNIICTKSTQRRKRLYWLLSHLWFDCLSNSMTYISILLWCMYDTNDNSNSSNNYNNSKAPIAVVTRYEIIPVIIYCIIVPNSLQTIIYHYNGNYHDFYSIAHDQDIDNTRHYSNRLFTHFHLRVVYVSLFYICLLVIYINVYYTNANANNDMNDNLSSLRSLMRLVFNIVKFFGYSSMWALIWQNRDNMSKFINTRYIHRGIHLPFFCLYTSIALWHLCSQSALWLWQAIVIVLAHLAWLTSTIMDITLWHQYLRLDCYYLFHMTYMWMVISICCAVFDHENQYVKTIQVVCVLAASMQILRSVTLVVKRFC